MQPGEGPQGAVLLPRGGSTGSAQILVGACTETEHQFGHEDLSKTEPSVPGTHPSPLSLQFSCGKLYVCTCMCLGITVLQIHAHVRIALLVIGLCG